MNVGYLIVDYLNTLAEKLVATRVSGYDKVLEKNRAVEEKYNA